MKKFQVDTENDKKTKIYQFSKFLCIFVIVPTDFEDWNNLRGKQGKCWFSSSLFRIVYFSFKVKMSQINTKIDEKSIFSNFQKIFMPFLLRFWQTWWIGTF